MGVESYMHLYAKATLLGWLRDAARAADGNNYASLQGSPISWRVNRDAPHFGIWEEYPISMEYGLTPVWDEFDCHQWQDAPPTREQCSEIGHRAECILDIAIQHKGVISYGIEIVHKNDVSDSKLQRLRECAAHQGAYSRIFTVPARWVLSQVGPPKSWAGVQII